MPTFDQAARHAASGESWCVSSHPVNGRRGGALRYARRQKLRQLVLKPGYRPMILQRAFYDKHELFTRFFSRIVTMPFRKSVGRERMISLRLAPVWAANTTIA